jgi:glycosyltransferase involved in cell wall biosynthesis
MKVQFVKKDKPLVSVITPAYNAERYIAETIDSVLGQTYVNWELIVINDGSTDKTGEIARSYRDPRIRYIEQENRGIAKTRNRLLKESKGEYITFLDSDDIYLPQKVEEEADFLETHPEYAAAYCDLRYFFDKEPGKLYRHTYTFPSGDVFKELLKRQFITNTTLMIRRLVIEKLGLFNEATREVEDWSYFLKMAWAGMKFGFINKDLVRFRLRWDNNTRFDKQILIQADAVDIFENLKQEMTKEEYKKYRMDDHIFTRRIRLAIIQLVEGRKQQAIRTLWSGTAFHPRKLFAEIFLIILCVLPRFVLRRLIEFAWNRKKKNLFVPVEQ